MVKTACVPRPVRVDRSFELDQTDATRNLNKIGAHDERMRTEQRRREIRSRLERVAARPFRRGINPAS